MDAKILYHGSRDGSVDKILDEGFVFSGKTNTLTPYSASFFDDVNDARRFSNDVVAYIVPKDLKMLDEESDEYGLYYFAEEKGRSIPRYQTLENLQEYGGYDGIVTDLTGQGMEYRIYNPKKLGKEHFISLRDLYKTDLYKSTYSDGGKIGYYFTGQLSFLNW